MQHPKDLLIAGFTYELPDDKIARYPLPDRDASKLLVNNKGQISESVFSNIAAYIPAGALLVFNNSKVIQSRLSFSKPSGGVIEIFILEPSGEYGEITMAMKTTGSIRCQCLVGGAKKWKQGKLTLFRGETSDGKQGIATELTAEMIEKKGDGYLIEFCWDASLDFASALELFGSTPIPPYLNRPSENTDRQRYQTIYAEQDGSVAAPTAGLHFTDAVMQSLREKKIAQAYVTLHVGAGTFKPVKSETIAGHEMHAEFITVEAELIKLLMQHEEVIPVGTTSMRTIESLYWMGVKTMLNKNISPEQCEVTQWEVYDKLMQHELPKKEALASLLDWMKGRQLQRISLRTQIMIAPPYKAKIATSIITNFHQPQSTLLLLIAALAGEQWKQMYQYALENNFRFLSYGDSSLIIF